MQERLCGVNTSPSALRIPCCSQELIRINLRDFFPSLKEMTLFSHRKHDNSKDYLPNFCWGVSQCYFSCCHSHLQIPNKCSKSGSPFCTTLGVYSPRGWVLHACVSGFRNMAWMRLPLEELAPWIVHGRHTDSVC